ncbi:DUF3291 domain-containing protein [Lichenibacterium minor]|uniref:DUF3291 domain-containing protein n=1 Tax=Lichenibacterium minor TaxID=2316528 RepID=A0A4Q2U4B0_9HYPH|nr:DUF3291 domain-containing protein [Lichenibacterium minor]RYC29747.1 DUF3291 domain-containing protein [Lichenibacterium minor]
MPFVSLTRLRLRSIRFLPAFARHNLRTLAQVKAAPGFRGGSLLADRGWAFWTLTAWDGQDAMRAYMTAGAHRTAMPYLLEWCDEASVAHWTQDGDALPSWAEADRRMRDEGRPSKLRHPGPHHADLGFRAARTAVTAPLRPAPARVPAPGSA